MNIEINVPNSLSEITLAQFQEFNQKSKDVTSEYVLQRLVLSIFCGVNLKDTMKVKASDSQAVYDIVMTMFNDRPQRITSFKMDGVDYGIIPDLDDMTLGEYVDLDKFIVDYDTMHYAMAVLYRPIKNRHKNLYNIEEYVPEKYDMKNIPMSAVLYGVVFFYNLGSDLLRVTNHYSNQAEMDLQEKMDSTKNGDGSQEFMLSLTEILQNLNISLN